ncbi:uncharacterized protein LOC144944419 [Lampetra fluviatilis]
MPGPVLAALAGLGRLLAALALLCERLERGLGALCALCRGARTAGAWAARACAGVDAACGRWARAAAPLLLGYAWLCGRVAPAVAPAARPAVDPAAGRPRAAQDAPTRPKGL